jgi:molecular chaperone GrpE
LESETGPEGLPSQGPAANEPTLQAPPEPAPDLPQQLQAARDQAAENYELYLRARADLENARRRALDDIAKTQKYAIEAFAEALVPVADSLERALQFASTDAARLQEGVQITLKQLQAAFERARLSEINPVGEKFDPHRHQAISIVPAGGRPNHVVAVLQKGWMIADRVLRPALVTVSQGTDSTGAT